MVDFQTGKMSKLNGVHKKFIVATAQATVDDSGPFSVIEKMVTYENSNQLALFPELWIKERKDDYKSFLYDQTNTQNQKGLFGIKGAKIINWKELPLDIATSYTLNAESFLQEYPNVKFYYIAFDYQVKKEDKYFLNGINYSIATVVLEDGQWKIAQIQKAPVNSLITDNVGFNTDDEKEMARINKEAYTKGKFINRKGETLETNVASDDELKRERGETPLTPEQVKEKLGMDVSSTSTNFTTSSVTPDSMVTTAYSYDHARPAYIKVRMTTSRNIAKYGSGDGNIDLYTYVKNVLPNEWGSSWNIESLKTGAMCVKMYAWFAHYHDVGYGISADVYDDERDQVFLAETETYNTTNAINIVGGVGMHRKDNYALFLTSHIQGYENTGNKASGTVWQLGSKYFGDHGYPSYWILQYYYNDSAKVGGPGKGYEFFTY